MPTLTFTIRWLTEVPGLAAYHGEEWPPSPSRLFRALLAGACRPGGAGERGILALERLERVGPPVIVGPLAERLAPVRSAVPNNDSDRVFRLYAKGASSQARTLTSKLKTLRSRQGWTVLKPVQYCWTFEGEDKDPEAFEALATGLSILGQGADLVCAKASWSDHQLPHRAYAWVPDDVVGDEAMPIPSEGEIRRLRQRYVSERQRVAGLIVSSTSEPVVAMARYRDPLGLPSQRWQAFALRTANDASTLALPGHEAIRVSGMVRHAIDQAARTAGLDEATRTEIMGHGGPGRFNVLPVPNIGHKHADGRIRRLIVGSPRSVSETIWAQIISRLIGAELIDAGSREMRGILAPITKPDNDPILPRFTSRSSHWASATPLILPGFDRRGGRSRSAKIVRRMLDHARIPEEAVRHVRLDHAAGIRGVARSEAVEVPHYLRHYPRKFIRIEFHRPVPGPLALGAGRGSGLGVLMHNPIEEIDDSRGRARA